MLKEDSAFSPAQVGYLFTFLARQIAKGLYSLCLLVFSVHLFMNLMNKIELLYVVQNFTERWLFSM